MYRPRYRRGARTHNVSGKEVNALGYYPNKPSRIPWPCRATFPSPRRKSVGAHPLQETYTDPRGYVLKDGELLWKRTLGRPLNFVTLPADGC